MAAAPPAYPVFVFVLVTVSTQYLNKMYYNFLVNIPDPQESSPQYIHEPSCEQEQKPSLKFISEVQVKEHMYPLSLPEQVSQV